MSKDNKYWIVCSQKRTKTEPSESVYGSAHKTDLQFVFEPSFGKHGSRDDALKSLVLTFYPENKDSNIEHIKRISKEFLKGSVGHFKIMKAIPENHVYRE